MCPAAELRSREQALEVSRFETRQPASARPRRIDPALAVKKYRRCAAGTDLGGDNTTVRPPAILLRTLRHLLQVVLDGGALERQLDGAGGRGGGNAVEAQVRAIDDSNDAPLLERYNFVADRIRSLRQDATMQRVQSGDGGFPEVVALYRVCARFFAWAGYALRKCDEAAFVRKMHAEALSSCFARLQELEAHRAADQSERMDGAVAGASDTVAGASWTAPPRHSAAESTALHLAFLAGCRQPTGPVLAVASEEMLRQPPLQWVLALLGALAQQSWVRFFRLCSGGACRNPATLDRPEDPGAPFRFLALCLLHPALSAARQHGAATMNRSFQKQELFPVPQLAELFGFGGDVAATECFCRATKLSVEEEEEVREREGGQLGVRWRAKPYGGLSDDPGSRATEALIEAACPQFVGEGPIFELLWFG